MLLHDFTHHNIEMACGLLETCGRFLYRSQESHHRTKVYLVSMSLAYLLPWVTVPHGDLWPLQEVMMRKKSALHLDSRYTTMIENAFYYSNPPEVKVEARQERPPMHQYIRKLLYKDLNKITVEKVCIPYTTLALLMIFTLKEPHSPLRYWDKCENWIGQIRR